LFRGPSNSLKLKSFFTEHQENLFALQMPTGSQIVPVENYRHSKEKHLRPTSKIPPKERTVRRQYVITGFEPKHDGRREGTKSS